MLSSRIATSTTRGATSTTRGATSTTRVELAIGKAESGQRWAGPKPSRAKIGSAFFGTKILTAQPALKTGLVGSNSLSKAKKIRAAQAGPGHILFGQIWLGFFGPII